MIMRIVFEQKKQTHHYATLKKNGHDFEVIIIPDAAIKFRKGELTDVRDALEFEQIYSDAHKAEAAADLEENFGTDNKLEIAAEIIKSLVLEKNQFIGARG